MPSTERRQRRIDAKLPETSAAVGTPVTTSAGTAVSPEIPTPVAPSGLTATGTYVVNSAVTPQAVVNLRWVAVTSPTPDAYAIQWALDSGFTNPTTVITAREQVTAAVSGLPVNRTVWFRIAARWQWVQSAWSAAISTTTANDTTPSALPTGATATFGNLTGNLTVNWINPTSANYRDIEIKIYNQSGGTELRTEYVRDSPYVYSLDMNKTDTSSAGDPSLYLELRSRTFANVFSSTAVTLSPTFATPAQVTGVTASANSVTGSLTFVYPSVATAVAYRLTLDGVARETTSTTYEYTRALNQREHNGSFDTSIAYSIVAVDVFGQVSATATTGTATFGVPAQPGGVTADFSQPDCRFIWTAATDALGYRLSIDGVDRDLGYTDTHTYTLARNAAEHVSGIPDHTLSWSLVAYNLAGSSIASTGTVTSPAPSAPSNVAITAFFSTLAVTVTHTQLPTHRTYQYRVTQNSGAFITTKQNSQVFTTSISAGGTYQAFVLVEDVFGRQTSPETSSAAVVADTLTIAELRAEGTYTDNQTINNTLTDGTNTLLDDNTLVLVDGDDLNELKDNSTTSSGVTYSAGTAWQNVTRFERPLTERYRTITAGLFAPTTNTQMYVSTSVDGSTWRWFAEPLTSVTSASATLSEVISETAARAAPVAIGSNATVTRWDLPRIVEARYVRLHHRNTTPASYVLYEFYPRRLVQSDDIEAESIKAINISAEAITADKISANAINGKTITGATVQTSAGTGTRVVLDSTGLTTFNSGGNKVVELITANNGEIRLIGNSQTGNQKIQWTNTSNANIGTITSWYNPSATPPEAYLDINAGTAGAFNYTRIFAASNVYISMADAAYPTYIVNQDTQIIIDGSFDYISFHTANTQRAQIDANGFGIGITPTARNNTTLQLANGIGFPATEVASSDANTLDDYSEGTWTPTVVFSGGTGGFTYDHQVGRYTKIGRLVHVQGSVQFDETAASGNLSIGGLPYSASTTTNNNAGGTLHADGLTGVSGQIMYLLGGAIADKQMEVYFSGTGGRTRITNTHTGTNTMFAFSICYHV